MARLLTTAGAKLFIGPVKEYGGTDFVEADFSSITGAAWVEIKGTTNLGGAGDTAELVTSNQIATRRTRKGKGTKNAGSMAVVADLDYADAGQLALVAAEKSDDTYAFKLVFDDQPTGGTPSERKFVALVMSVAEQYNEANSVMQMNASLEIDSNIVRKVAASA